MDSQTVSKIIDGFFGESAEVAFDLLVPGYHRLAEEREHVDFLKVSLPHPPNK
jgi:hypothetical protein